MASSSKDPTDHEEGEDEQVTEEMKYLQVNQTPNERRRVRRGYRTLINQMQREQCEHTNPMSNRLDEVLEEANILNRDVRMPREGALDSQAVFLIANLGRQRADKLHTDFVKFEPSEYAEKLITFMESGASRDSEEKVNPQGWVMLGAAVEKFFNKTPVFNYMSGTFERGVPTVPKKIAKTEKQQDENTTDKVTVPKKLNSFAESGKSEGTTQEVEKVYDLLKKYYRDTENNPICYFEFVLNPFSFGQTIENIFYVSFLVRDGHARITLNEDRLPLIEPVEGAEGENAPKKEKSHQSIISLTPGEWKELLQVFNIEEPVIPTRNHQVPSQSQRQVLEPTSGQSNVNTRT